MADYRTVNPQRLLAPLRAGCSDFASLIYVHLLLGPLSRSFPGLIAAGPLTLAESMSRDSELPRVREALEELCTRKDPLNGRPLADYDPDLRVIRLVGVLVDHIRQTTSADSLRGWLRAATNVPRSPIVVAHLGELLELDDHAPGRNAKVEEAWKAIRSEAIARGLPASTVPHPGGPMALPEHHEAPSGGPHGGPGRGRSVKEKDQDQDQDQGREKDQGDPQPARRSAERIIASLAEQPHPPGKKPLRNTPGNRVHLETLLDGGELAEEVLYISLRYLAIVTTQEPVPRRSGPPKPEDPGWYDLRVWSAERWPVVRSLVEASDHAEAARLAAEHEAAAAAAAAGAERDRLAEAAARARELAARAEVALARGDSFATITSALNQSDSHFARTIIHHLAQGPPNSASNHSHSEHSAQP